MPRRFQPYTRLAEIWDEIGQDRFSARMVDYTFQILKRKNFQPRSALDLCCGTGTAAIRFARKGWEVYGLDGSADMLRLAAMKIRKERVKVNLIHQRLPEFEIRHTGGLGLKMFDLVTSYYDSLNYLLKEEELSACFRNLNRHLNPNGLFIFDMNTKEALKCLWGDKVYARSYDNVAWIWQSLFYERASQADLRAVCFVRKGKLWERFEEVHTEKAYPTGDLKRLLRQAGFQIEHLYDCFRFVKPKRGAYRIAVVARKVRNIA
jgi:SAM-dependent methyltransferase